MGRRTVVLGGGFGGVAAATSLARAGVSGHEVVLVDVGASFMMGLAKLGLLDGSRVRAESERDLALVARSGARFVQGVVRRIDLEERRVVVDDESIAYDHLVVALGASLSLDAVPGLANAARDVYSVAGVEALHRELSDFEGGDVLFVVAALPVKCPPAPYEAAMLASAFLRRRRVEARVAIASPEPHPLPVAGPECGQTVREWCEERGVEVLSSHTVASVDASARTVHFADGSQRRYDLLAAVPTHRVPRVLVEAGLASEGGWVEVDPFTLETRVPNVWAIGDCTLVKTPSGKPLVKAGVMAEGEARVVVANLAARLRGEPEAARFDGKGHCYLDLGDGLAVEVRGDFYALPQPVVAASVPSRATSEAKLAFERERLLAWFGQP